MTVVKAPIAGTLVPLSQVPDPVFAQEMLGPGFAIFAPWSSAEGASPDPITAVSPVSGTVAALKPHAFIVKTSGGFSVLVHLGIDTVTGPAEQFEALKSPTGAHWQTGDAVAAGSPMITWTPQSAESGNELVMVTLLDLPANTSISRDYPEGTSVTNATDVISVALP